MIGYMIINYVLGNKMVYEFIFSIICAVYNCEEYLDETIMSVISQDIGFEENIELILVDDGSDDNSLKIANKYKDKFPHNIVVLSKENGGQASARNLGLNYCSGEFINFLDGDDVLSLNTLSSVHNFFINNSGIDLVSIPLIFFGRFEGEHFLNYKFKRERIINLEKEYYFPQLSGASSFIRYSVIKNHKFNENLINGEDLTLINEILSDNKKYGVINSAKYFYRKRSDFSSATDKRFISKREYIEKMNLSYKHLIDHCLSKEHKVPKFIQFVIALDLRSKKKKKNFEKIIHEKEDINQFWKSLDYILKYIDEDIILNHKLLTNQIKMVFITLKNKDFHVDCIDENKQIFLKSNNYIINRLHKRKIILDVIEYKNNFLNISGCFISNCDNKFIDFELIKNSASIQEIFKPVYKEYDDRHTIKYLSLDWKFYKSFDFKIPIDDNPASLYFKLIFNEDNKYMERKIFLTFNKYSILTRFFSYFIMNSKIIFQVDSTIFIYNYSFFKMLKREFADIKKILNIKPPQYFVSLFYRIIHLLIFPFIKNKRIWLFEDSFSLAGDNAEYLFDYSINQDDNIKKYFLISKNSKDYNRLSKKYKNIVKWGSFKHKLLYMFGEKIISSEVDHKFLNPFYDKNLQVYNGLSSIQHCFLQQSICKTDRNDRIKKFNINLFLFLICSNYEFDYISEKNYNYDDNIIQKLGFPRYDKLSLSNSKKQISFVFCLKDLERKHCDYDVSNIKYINSLLNNKKLSNYLHNAHYKAIFYLDFDYKKYMELFNIPDYFEVYECISYQHLVNESNILVTDFSTISFDFAYLKKPIVHYQRVPNVFNDFDFENNGFGEVFISENELVDKIIYYIENNCIMEEEYQFRVNNFFEYFDNNNCQRVYKWILENK